MVRINPFIDLQTNWQDGPYWQHIPPLYMYVPLPFINILNDGVPDASIIRISYISVMFLALIIFITAVYLLERNIFALIASTLASIILVNFTDFAGRLMTGYAFNHSDIVLFGSVVCSFFAILWYLQKEKSERLKYSILKISFIAIIVTLPMVIKTFLGAIPLATFLFLILKDNKKLFNKKILFSFLTPLIVLLVFYLPLYFASPDTFSREFLTPFNHINGKEGYIFPWHFYVSYLLPYDYFKIDKLFYYIGFIISVIIFFVMKLNRKTKNILLLSGVWFVWNLIVISITSSKIPNFIFQTYIYFLFFIIYSFTLLIKKIPIRNYVKIKSTFYLNFSKKPIFYRIMLGVIFIPTVFYPSKVILDMAKIPKDEIVLNYEEKKLRNLSEMMRDIGVNSKDLTILYTSQLDCCSLKYHMIFNTGAESHDFKKIKDVGLDIPSLKNKYDNIYIILRDVIKDTSNLNIKHKTNTNIEGFTIIKINTYDLTESFEKDINEFINNLPYKTVEEIY
jgi:hypothetical protein